MSYTDESTSTNWLKTLVIRNTPDGMIWQIYHVQNQEEAEWLSSNATRNGFYGITLEDYSGHEETFPDWRKESDKPLFKIS